MPIIEDVLRLETKTQFRDMKIFFALSTKLSLCLLVHMKSTAEVRAMQECTRMCACVERDRSHHAVRSHYCHPQEKADHLLMS